MTARTEFAPITKTMTVARSQEETWLLESLTLIIYLTLTPTPKLLTSFSLSIDIYRKKITKNYKLCHL